MKTKLEISDDLLARSKEIAQREGTTVGILIEEGLRVVLAQRGQAAPYVWPDLSVGGEGLAPEIEEGILDRSGLFREETGPSL